MKQNESSPGAEERVLHTLRRQQRILQWLTALAVGFWLVAVLASVSVLIGYALLYAPKEKHILSEYGSTGHLVARMNSPSGGQPVGRMDTDQALAIHFGMNAAVTRGLLLTAASVIAISAGTLVTLLLVVLNRRITLKQINHSLAQISQQLRALPQR